MPVMSIPFEVGTYAWFVRAVEGHAKIPCPMCEGCLCVKIVTQKETMTVPCECCSWGFEGPHGFINIYDSNAPPIPERVLLRRVVNVSGTSVSYSDSDEGSSCYSTWSSEHLFSDEASCNVACKKYHDERRQQDVLRILNEKNHRKASMIKYTGFGVKDRDALRRKIEKLSEELAVVENRLHVEKKP
jgi:hypothetical protein